MTVTRVHLIGIGGTAMATLAAMLKARGIDVRGSDRNVYPPMSDFLRQQGITVLEGYRPEHVGAAGVDLVIVGNAVSRGNPELEEVLDRKIRYCSLPEAIRDHFLWGARSIVVSGTHGKTTTTALAAWILTAGGLDPSALMGGIATNFQASYRLGGGRDFVIEGDEYDSAYFDKTAKFLKYLPDILVVSNVEFDHADVYPNLEAIRVAFRRLAGLVPRRGRVLLGADSAEAAALAGVAHCPVETFGLAGGADWQARDVAVAPGGTRFRVLHRGELFGAFEVPLIGGHNVRNALAAMAVGAAVGLDARTLEEGMRTFLGVRRRLEIRGSAGGVTVYDDFAHHPTAVAETLAAVRAALPGRRLWAVFEPRSATSCRRVFQEDFARALAAADEVVIAAVFRSELSDAERLSAEQLAADLQAGGTNARYIPEVGDIVRAIAREARNGDLVVVMSNGGFENIHRRLLDALAARAPEAAGGR